MMLRECCRNEDLTRIVLNSESFYSFFNYVEMSTFDIASDAFLTFKVNSFSSSIVLYSLRLQTDPAGSNVFAIAGVADSSQDDLC